MEILTKIYQTFFQQWGVMFISCVLPILAIVVVASLLAVWICQVCEPKTSQTFKRFSWGIWITGFVSYVFYCFGGITGDGIILLTILGLLFMFNARIKSGMPIGKVRE